MQTAQNGEKMEAEDTKSIALHGEIEAEAGTEADTKNRSRRNWQPKEEERFFEIWGRENWRLTRHGKNTVFFAQWAEEMKDVHGIDVKPEEVQAKVNQTRAKFRQAGKQMAADKNATRWKKYDIIDKILKNQYRPEDAEPVPVEDLTNNRVTKPRRSRAKPKPIPPIVAISNPTPDETPHIQDNGVEETQMKMEDASLENFPVAELDITATSLYNSNETPQTNAAYTTEMFTDPMEQIKPEFLNEIKCEEFQTNYHNYQYTEQNHYSPEQEPQLHQLQTPQQLQQQLQEQQYQQIQHQQPLPATTPPALTVPVPVVVALPLQHPQQHLAQHIQQLQQHQQEQQQQQQQQQVQQVQQTVYDPATTNTYIHVTAPHENGTLVLNNQNHFVPTAPTPPLTPISLSTPQTPPMAIENNGTASSVYNASPPITRPTTTTNINRYGRSNAINKSNEMPPPPPPPPRVNPVKRKRRTQAEITAAAAPLTAETFETVYLTELRKKNLLLDEQKEISRKRLMLEERKITLMEEFFPKCLQLQEKIFQKLNKN